jgi:hypothetical protein
MKEATGMLATIAAEMQAATIRFKIKDWSIDVTEDNTSRILG